MQIEVPVSFAPGEVLWETMIENNQVDDESYYILHLSSDNFLDDLSEDELLSLYCNVLTWKHRVHTSYLEKTRRFRDLRYASRSDYAKHYPPAGATRAEVEQNSKMKRLSIFYRDIPEHVMLGAFFLGLLWLFDWEGLDITNEQLWDDLINCRTKKRIVFQSNNIIGVANGYPTCFVCYEIEASRHYCMAIRFQKRKHAGL